MRNASSTTSLQYSDARHLAMPASRALRAPLSFVRRHHHHLMGGLTFVPISASRNMTA
jgi:hypothetical protein